MAKRKSGETFVDERTVAREFRQKIRELKEGKISRDEFVDWFRTHFGVKGKGILRGFLRQRELARGWDTKATTKKSSS